MSIVAFITTVTSEENLFPGYRMVSVALITTVTSEDSVFPRGE